MAPEQPGPDLPEPGKSWGGEDDPCPCFSQAQSLGLHSVFREKSLLLSSPVESHGKEGLRLKPSKWPQHLCTWYHYGYMGLK